MGEKAVVALWNRRTAAAPREAALGRELIAWAADRPITPDGCIFCGGGYKVNGEEYHTPDCFGERARALRGSE